MRERLQRTVLYYSFCEPAEHGKYYIIYQYNLQVLMQKISSFICKLSVNRSESLHKAP